METQLMCPMIKVLSNGLWLEADSALGDFSVVIPGIMIAVILAMKFSEKLKIELSPILHSIDELKGALSNSLKEQWDLEQRKNLQISSLAYDLKTSLTIIKGNTLRKKVAETHNGTLIVENKENGQGAIASLVLEKEPCFNQN